MSAVAAPATNTVRFPSENEISAYIKTLPMTITGIAVNLYVPNFFASLAKYFANKEIPMDQLTQEVKAAVELAIEENGTEDQKEFHKQVQGCSDYQSDNIFAIGSKCDSLSSAINAHRAYLVLRDKRSKFRFTLFVCEMIMKDVLDKAIYTPPEVGSGKWTRTK